MELNDTQRQAVRDWVKQGAGLSEVQKRLRDEFGLAMTYMDVRLLVLDLGAAVKDKPEPKKPAAPPPAAPADADTAAGDEDFAEDADALPGGEAPAGSQVSVTLDRVVQAGALASGTVVFSDGTRARWLLDQMGRLALDAPGHPGYRPSPGDIQAFQLELRNQLSRRGY